MKDFIEVIDATYAVKNESLKNNSGLVHGTRTLEELSCTLLTHSAIPVQRLYQLSKQAIWEQAI